RAIVFRIRVLAEVYKTIITPVQVCQPDLPVAGAVRDEGHLTPLRRPDWGIIGPRVISEANRLLIPIQRGEVDIQTRWFLAAVAFVGQPLPVRRPGRGCIIFGSIGYPGDLPIRQIEHVQVPLSL